MSKSDPDMRLAGTKHIAIALLRVDPAYQRDLDPARVKKIAENFDAKLFDPIKVTPRDGVYYVTDGQHRLAALRLLGWSYISVPCVIVHLATQEQEAGYFRKQNTNRRPPTAYDDYKAARVEHDEAVMVIASVLKRLSLEAVSLKSTSPNGIRAVGAIREIYRFHGDEMLERVLRVSLAAWPHEAIHGRSAVTLDALVAFIATHAARGRVVEDAALIKVCSMRSAAQFMDRRATAGIPAYKAMAADLQEPYNRVAKRALKVELLTPGMYSKRPRRPTEAAVIVIEDVA